jgi:hypothetical protein
VQYVDDCRLCGTVDFRDEIVLLLGGYAQMADIETGAIDDLAGAAGSLDGDGELGMLGITKRRWARSLREMRILI